LVVLAGPCPPSPSCSGGGRVIHRKLCQKKKGEKRTSKKTTRK
jgi:hypothetical protein